MNQVAKAETGPTPLGEALKRARTGFLVVALFSLVLNLLMLTTPIYMLQVFQRVLGSGHVETLIFLTLIAGFALLILGVLDMLRVWVLSRIGVWLNLEVSPAVMAASLNHALASPARNAQSLRDLAQVQGFVGGQGITAFLDSPWVPVFVAVIWLMHPWLGVLALVSAAVLFGVALINELTTRKPLREAGLAQISADRFADSVMRNAEAVRGMGMGPAVLETWKCKSAPGRASRMAAEARNGFFTGLTKFLRLFVQIAILGLGAFLVLKGELTPGQMIAGSILLSRALAPVEQSIGGWRAFTNTRNAYGRLQQLFRIASGLMDNRTRLPAPAGGIEVLDATFVPPGGEEPILRRIAFRLEPGEVLAINGPSASGKSTLCRLLVGVWAPTAGHLRLDGAEIADWRRDEFGRHVGYLPQDVELFAGTVRENIARFQDCEDDAVVSAAQQAGAHEMILRLPKGYDTPIGDAGVALSGGQRQRIGLARALFGQPVFVVLDEPNANLDAEGETALVHAIAGLKQRGAAVVMAWHRAYALEHVDKLLLLREGRMQGFGARDEILARLRQQSAARQPGAADGRGTPHPKSAGGHLKRVPPAKRE
jgi:ATP-binding cassette subfamily C protein/ATP-binding cassette subfamily C exporter for protease/lipase/ATP-binding cassette subfamily C protein EexD